MALTAQNIIDSVSSDMRAVLGSSGADATLILDWVDRIHKDALHTSIYNFLSQGEEDITTVALTSEYVMTAVDIRKVLSVYDRAFERLIVPLESLGQPSPQADQAQPNLGGPQVQEKVVLANATQRGFVEFYKLYDVKTMRFYPAPVYPGTIEVVYDKQVTTLTAVGDSLVIPEDGKDMMVAGVNLMTAQYLKRTEEAVMWAQIYQNLKLGQMVV